MGGAPKQFFMGLRIMAYVAITAVPLSLLSSFSGATSWGCLIALFTAPSTPLQAMFMAIFGRFTWLSRRAVIGWGFANLFTYLAHFWYYSGLWPQALPARSFFFMASWIAIALTVQTPRAKKESEIIGELREGSTTDPSCRISTRIRCSQKRGKHGGRFFPPSSSFSDCAFFHVHM